MVKLEAGVRLGDEVPLRHRLGIILPGGWAAVGAADSGQKGHAGATRSLFGTPDHPLVIALSGVCGCGRALSAITVEALAERRQVVDMRVRRELTEYRTVRGVCVRGQSDRSAWPDSVTAPVLYGPRVSALAVSLTHYQQQPYQRTAELLQGVAGIALCPPMPPRLA